MNQGIQKLADYLGLWLPFLIYFGFCIWGAWFTPDYGPNNVLNSAYGNGSLLPSIIVMSLAIITRMNNGLVGFFGIILLAALFYGHGTIFEQSIRGYTTPVLYVWLSIIGYVLVAAVMSVVVWIRKNDLSFSVMD